jgi:hypothetical protein
MRRGDLHLVGETAPTSTASVRGVAAPDGSSKRCLLWGGGTLKVTLSIALGSLSICYTFGGIGHAIEHPVHAAAGVHPRRGSERSPDQTRARMRCLRTPVARNTISRLLSSGGKVKVMRGSPVGLVTSSTQRLRSSRERWFGNSEAVCPSAPIPKSARSNSGRRAFSYPPA